MERYNPRLNAIITTDLEAARKRARAADAALRKGTEWGPLHGVPMTIKESYDVTGMPTTWGVPALKANFPARNALTVDRLLAAGVVLFGKTNVPIYLADWQSYNEIYGTTNNPWDLTRSPGGSSGGSAAALAAGPHRPRGGQRHRLVHPQSRALLRGVRPQAHLRRGARRAARRCRAGSRRATSRWWGRWGGAPTTSPSASPRWRAPTRSTAQGWRLELPAPRQRALRDFRVAVMLTDPVSEVDAEVQDRIQAVADFLARRRAKVSDRARPDIDTAESHRVYVQLLRSATSGRLTPSEFRADVETAAPCWRPTTSATTRASVRANTLSHRDWLAANEARHQMRWKWAEFFREWDVLLCPPAATAAFPHDHVGERHERTIVVNGRRVPTTDQLFWAGYSGMVYLPGHGGPGGLHAGRAAGGGADRGPAVRRPHHHRAGAAARARVPGLRAAARLRVRPAAAPLTTRPPLDHTPRT